MTIETTKSAEVSVLRRKILPVVRCSTCAIGLAVDMVGKHWNEPEYDWKGEAFGHECPVATGGLSAAQRAALAAIDAEYTGGGRA